MRRLRRSPPCTILTLLSPGSFGHGGAEGTFAWYDPVQRLMVLYLTQSNGNDTRPTVPRLVYRAILE